MSFCEASMSNQRQARAQYKKWYRKKLQEEKRFNRVMKNYLQVKHSNIYEQCCEFYEYLNKRNPSAKDLTKSMTYKEWAKNHQAGEQNDEDVRSPVKLVTFTIKDPELQSETVTFSHVASETITSPVAEEEDQSEVATDPLSVAIQDLFPPVYEGFNDIEINQVDNIIAEIINELEQDEAAQNLMNVENDQDEGIGLNLEDEIEDFNFNEEVGIYY